MANMRDLRTRINSVRATQKITSAMKMVAGAKLKRAQDALASARPYAQNMRRIVMSLAQQNLTDTPHWMVTGHDEGAHLILVVSANRGLCGGYNSSLVRETRTLIQKFEKEKTNYRLAFIGKKAFENLRRLYSDHIIDLQINGDMNAAESARTCQQKLVDLFKMRAVGQLTIISGNFKNVLTQEPRRIQMVPLPLEDMENIPPHTLCEPDANTLIPMLLEDYLTAQILGVLLENATCEQAARMAAMDNATRNAREMMHDLQLVYNRTRQAKITTELIEIISGAKALNG